MKYKNLGKTGLKVSRLCLGCMSYTKADARSHMHAGWAMDEEKSRESIKHALEKGINFLDTADAYGFGASEEVVGRAIKDFAKRSEIVLATKVFFPMTGKPNGGGLSRKHIMEAIDASLMRLGTDYVDLYQIHRWDYFTPIEETMEALDDVVKSGKALYIGASSMFAYQFAKAQHAADLRGGTRFVSMQPQYNLIYREEEREMFRLCAEDGIGVIPWSPLARGFLAGNRKREGGGETARANTDANRLQYSDTDFDILERLQQVAKARGVPPMQIAMAWVLANPVITAPIVGATKLSHIDDAVAALEIELSAEEKKILEELYKARELGQAMNGPLLPPN